MNYIKELNAFHARQETEPLTMTAAYLWIVLMDINNRAGWKKQFSVAASLLCAKTVMKEGNFKRARNELKEKGYIRVQSRGANLAALYEMVSLANRAEETCDDNSDVTHASNSDWINDHSNDCMNAPLFKRNKTKQKENNITDTAANATRFYLENFISTDQDDPMNPYLEGSLLSWTQAMGETLVLAAMKRALDRNKGTWGYTRAILQNWKDEGVRTLNDVREADAAFKKIQAKRTKSSGRAYKGQEEVVPDWFRERKIEREAAAGYKASVPKLSVEEAARERAEVVALLKKHSSSG